MSPRLAASTRTTRGIDLAIAGLVALLCLWVFSPALEAQFVDFDDELLYVSNDRFRGFGAQAWRWMWSARRLGHWQPLTWMSVAVDDAISGRDPSSYHRTNLILHAVDAALVYLVALRLFRSACLAWIKGPEQPKQPEKVGPIRIGAAFAALFFGVHPLRVESVAWVTERRDVLSTLFLLGALAAHMHAITPRVARLRSRGWYLASILLLGLSLCSKAWGVSFVAVLLILDVWPYRRISPHPASWLAREARPVLMQKIPYAVLGMATVVIASWAVRESPGIVLSLDQWSLGARIAQAFHGLGFYIQKTVWPTDLVALIELPEHLDVSEPRFFATYAIVLLVAVLGITLRRKLPALATTALVYAIVVAPVLGFAQVGPQLVADRYSYVSCISWSVLAGAGVIWTWHASKSAVQRAALVFALSGILAALSMLCWRQTFVWRDSRALWSHALAVGRPSAIAHRNLGLIELDAGQTELARSHFAAAVAIRSDQGDAWISLAGAQAALGRLEDAEKSLLEATRCTIPAWLAWMRLGRLYRDGMGRREQALLAYERAVGDVEAGPPELFNPKPYLELGRTLTQTGDAERARPFLERAGRFAPTAQEAKALLEKLK